MMELTLFSGSLRKDSFNTRLIHIAKSILDKNPKNKTSLVDLKSLNMPVYDGDIESVGIPNGVLQLADSIQICDALIISSPEYNGSIAGSLKNTIDWVSRVKPMPLDKKPVLLMGTSPGYFGAIRGLQHARTPFETLGAFVFPQTFALPKAGDVLSAAGEFTDQNQYRKLDSVLANFLDFAEKFKSA